MTESSNPSSQSEKEKTRPREPSWLEHTSKALVSVFATFIVGSQTIGAVFDSTALKHFSSTTWEIVAGVIAALLGFWAFRSSERGSDDAK